MSYNKEILSSRERVIQALNHEPVDRVPIDLGMHHSTGISAFAYWNLREHLGLSTDHIVVWDPVQFLARVDEDILERFHCDCIVLHPGWTQSHAWNPRSKYSFVIPEAMRPYRNEQGGWVVRFEGAEMVMPEGGFFLMGHG